MTSSEHDLEHQEKDFRWKPAYRYTLSNGDTGLTNMTIKEFKDNLNKKVVKLVKWEKEKKKENLK